MLETYKALVHGNQIRWLGKGPETERPVEVDVTVLSRSPQRGSGQAMADALEELAKINAFKDITDPVAWQRQMRTDKPLLPEH